MHLTRLQVQGVRNLSPLNLNLHPTLNLFLGDNGAGKTSLLEAIYLLAVGRSFRTHLTQVAISHHAERLVCFGEVQGATALTLGIERNRSRSALYKVNGEPCKTLSEYASQLPLQLITPETFRLLLDGPQERRRYLDWGVFHVEPVFGETCQRYQRLLSQRNAALKQGMEAHIWDRELAELGEAISSLRQGYLDQLRPFLTELASQLLGFAPSVEYLPGWPEGQSLEDSLKKASAFDERRGYTSVGPHRAELQMRLENHAAHQILSRGQQKLWICALLLAQAAHLQMTSGKPCVYLIDDLASELDANNRQRLLSCLMEQGHQIFLTGVDTAWVSAEASFFGKMFHVEHGAIREATPQATEIA